MQSLKIFIFWRSKKNKPNLKGRRKSFQITTLKNEMVCIMFLFARHIIKILKSKLNKLLILQSCSFNIHLCTSQDTDLIATCVEFFGQVCHRSLYFKDFEIGVCLSQRCFGVFYSEAQCYTRPETFRFISLHLWHYNNSVKSDIWIVQS